MARHYVTFTVVVRTYNVLKLDQSVACTLGAERSPCRRTFCKTGFRTHAYYAGRYCAFQFSAPFFFTKFFFSWTQAPVGDADVSFF